MLKLNHVSFIVDCGSLLKILKTDNTIVFLPAAVAFTLSLSGASDLQ